MHKDHRKIVMPLTASAILFVAIVVLDYIIFW